VERFLLGAAQACRLVLGLALGGFLGRSPQRRFRLLALACLDLVMPKPPWPRTAFNS